VAVWDNLADFLTKAVPDIKLHGNKIKLNMIICGLSLSSQLQGCVGVQL